MKFKMFIGGRWCDAGDGRTVQVLNPATEEAICGVPYGGPREAEEALDAARRAFRDWSRTSPYERGEVLKRTADLMRERRDELARLLTMEEGKPLAESRSEVEAAASYYEWFAEEGKRAYGQVVPATSAGKRHWVLKHPVGVCATIAPWNFPVLLQARKVAAALAAGCTVVSRPSTGTPLSTMEMFRCLEEAGVPPGVANLVTGPAGEVADVFLRSPICRKVSFTGSNEVGKELMRKGAEGLKKLSLELGGSAPVLVLPDVDVDRAARLCVMAKFRNAGQVCISPTRFYVHEDIKEEFTERCVSLARGLRVGNGLDPDVDMGPLYDGGAVRKMEALVEDAVRKGAKVLCGGGPPEGEEYSRGFWFAPTVLVDVDGSMRVSREEVFGPIMPIFGFRTVEEAVKSANDTPYGLAAYVLTHELEAALKLAEALEFGIVGINDMVPATAQCPFGGMKESGVGREGAHEGLEEYLESKYVSVAL